MDTKYSLTTLLNDLLKLQNNGYQIITKLSDVVSSNADTVEIEVADSNGVIQKVYVPSFGAIKQQIVQLENNVKSISGVGDGDTSVQLSDGSFRKILISTLQKEAQTIKSMNAPLNFNTRENWFFESFLNPLLYVSFDLTNQVKYNTENVEIARYILNLDTQQKKTLFEREYLNNSSIDYISFIKKIVNNNITYFLDKSVVDMPPRSLRYSGDFMIININDVTETVIVNEANVQKRYLQLQLDKLTYNDNRSQYLGTISLKINDSLVLNTGKKNTRFKVVSVDSSRSTVNVEQIEGFDSANIGSSMAFYGVDDSPVYSEVNIGFNENCVIFIKPIDPDSKIQATNWSPGVGIYTNDLVITDTKGNSMDLATYYTNEVVDFGSYLYSAVKDKTIPAIFGAEPNSPTIDGGDFKVLAINDHLTSSGSIEKLTKLNSDKIRIQSQISALDKSIADLRSKIQTTKYSSQKLEDTDRSELSKIIDERNSQSSLYNSTIEDINQVGDSESTDNLKTKYRIRGFFPIPEKKSNDRASDQEVIQFRIQYRYTKKDGSSNQPQQIPFTDNNGDVRSGTFSSWIEYKSKVRNRTINKSTGIASWASEDLESSESVNINQIDLPIQSGESVEFRIKSISEAGWPVTAVESEWSEIITVDFPSEFESIIDPNSIIEKARNEKIKVEFQSELVKMNLDKISDASFTQNNTFFTSVAQQIASGFLTSENNVISLYEKLTNIDQELVLLRSLIANAKGKIVISIVDEDGVEYSVTNNQTLKIFAGNYRDQVSSLPVKKGVIVTKNYFVKINNDAASELELYSRLFGSKYNKIDSSNTAGTNYSAQDIDYNKTRRYDFVPLGLSNPETSDIASYGFIRNTPDQSSQVMSQFINVRYKSIDSKSNLYSSIGATSAYSVLDSKSVLYNTTPYRSVLTSDLEHTASCFSNVTFTAYPIGSASTDFIWQGGISKDAVVSWNDASSLAGFTEANSILVHSDHPKISEWVIGGTVSSRTQAENYIRNSMLGSIPKGSTGYNTQTAFFYEGIGGTANKYAKIGFEGDDQYLIGQKSCGAYLYLNPTSHSNLIVNGSDSLSLQTISFGNNSGLNIPITFQYRMTDYFGYGNIGLGKVAGNPSSNSSTNIEYTKTIGLDIYANPLDKERFSFDLELTARYFSKSLITKDIPVRTFETALDDLTKTIKVVNPTTSRDISIRTGVSPTQPNPSGSGNQRFR